MSPKGHPEGEFAPKRVNAEASPVTAFDLEVFYDGACPMCTREIAMLRRLDRAGRIRFADIAAPGFDAGTVGVSQETLMARIHGRLPDGTLIDGVEVFRRLYTAVGFGPAVALTRLPGVSQLLDAAYAGFARRRVRLGGRCEEGTCAANVSGRGSPPTHG
jgi:predicted DCC family thiol-disulfide oxidoreductase YuxK